MSDNILGNAPQQQAVKEMDFEAYLGRVETLIAHATAMFRDPAFGEMIEEARRIFFAVMADEELVPEALKPIDQNNFMFYLLSDFPLGPQGESAMSMFLTSKAGEKLPQPIREIGEAIVRGHLSLFDVISVDSDTDSIALRDLFTMGLVRIEDPQLVHIANQPVFFGLRAIKLDGKHFSAGDMYVYPAELKERLLMFLRNQLTGSRAPLPTSLRETLKSRGYLFNHMQMMVRSSEGYRRQRQLDDEAEEEFEKEHPGAVHEPPVEPAEPAAPPEPDINPARANFMVNDYDKVKNILDSQALLAKKTEDPNSIEYAWYKSPASKERGESDGVVRLTKSKVIAECFGVENLETAKNFLLKALKPHAGHLYDELERRRSFARG